jgi:hypothetical protein
MVNKSASLPSINAAKARHARRHGGSPYVAAYRFRLGRQNEGPSHQGRARSHSLPLTCRSCHVARSSAGAPGPFLIWLPLDTFLTDNTLKIRNPGPGSGKSRVCRLFGQGRNVRAMTTALRLQFGNSYFARKNPNQHCNTCNPATRVSVVLRLVGGGDAAGHGE